MMKLFKTLTWFFFFIYPDGFPDRSFYLFKAIFRKLVDVQGIDIREA